MQKFAFYNVIAIDWLLWWKQPEKLFQQYGRFLVKVKTSQINASFLLINLVLIGNKSCMFSKLLSIQQT